MQVLLAIVLDISDTCLRTKHVAIPQKQRLSQPKRQASHACFVSAWMTILPAQN